MPGALYVSIDDFTHERFTNGLFLQVRELLQRVSERGLPAGLACITTRGGTGGTRRTRAVQGCTVHECFVRAPGEAAAYRKALHDLLEDLDPEVVLLNSCAVRLREPHLGALEVSLATGRRVVVLVTDQLYPTDRGHGADEMRRYYDLMRQADSVQAVSRTIADALRHQTGVQARVLPNLLPERRLLSGDAPGPGAGFLTLINHHPIKGRRVWDTLIRLRPDDTYLVVETWPDAPPYAPPSPNVRVAPFAPDPTAVYASSRMLLLPSLGPEGLPRVALEAMESGVPVIAHRIGSLPELGDAVTFVTPPPIDGYELDENDVLYPVVSASDLECSARDFIQAIDAIDGDRALRSHRVTLGRAFARDYRNHSEAVTRSLLDAWFSANGALPRG